MSDRRDLDAAALEVERARIDARVGLEDRDPGLGLALDDLPGEGTPPAIGRQDRGVEAHRTVSRMIDDLRRQDHRRERQDVQLGTERPVFRDPRGDRLPRAAIALVAEQPKAPGLRLFGQRIGTRTCVRGNVDRDDLVARVGEPHQHVTPERSLPEDRDSKRHARDSNTRSHEVGSQIANAMTYRRRPLLEGSPQARWTSAQPIRPPPRPRLRSWATVTRPLPRWRPPFATTSACAARSAVPSACMLDGRTVVELFGGHRERERRTPWQRDTLVNAYSVGKGITAMLVLSLVERGELELDRPGHGLLARVRCGRKGRDDLAHAARASGRLARRASAARERGDLRLVPDDGGAGRAVALLGARHGPRLPRQYPRLPGR